MRTYAPPCAGCPKLRPCLVNTTTPTFWSCPVVLSMRKKRQQFSTPSSPPISKEEDTVSASPKFPVDFSPFHTSVHALAQSRFAPTHRSINAFRVEGRLFDYNAESCGQCLLSTGERAVFPHKSAKNRSLSCYNQLKIIPLHSISNSPLFIQN